MGGGVGNDEKKERRDPKRRHGSTAFFVMVDYLFLLIFFCFLCYFLLKIWQGAALIPISW